MKTIYSRSGTPLTDIRTKVVRSSLLNDIGEAVFPVPYHDPKCQKKYLDFGNILLVEHETLPTWVGLIDLPRAWKRGFMELTAYEFGLILEYRFAPLNTKVSGTPGGRAAQLIDLANNQEDTLIRVGYIDPSGASSETRVNGSIFSHLKSLATDHGHEFTFTPVIESSGALHIDFSWYATAGIQTQRVLSQGTNLVYGEVPLQEDGELVNHVEAVIDIDATTEQGTVSGSYETQMPYGKRAIRTVVTGSVDSAALSAIAEQTVNSKKDPKLTAPLGAVDVDETFKDIRLGNTVTYKFPRVGFSDELGIIGMTKSVRVSGWRYDESAGVCEITVKT